MARARAGAGWLGRRLAGYRAGLVARARAGAGWLGPGLAGYRAGLVARARARAELSKSAIIFAGVTVTFIPSPPKFY